MNIFKRTNENIKMGEHIYYLQKKNKNSDLKRKRSRNF